MTLPRLMEKCLIPKWHNKKLELAGLVAPPARSPPAVLEPKLPTLMKWIVGCVHEVT